MTEIFLKFLDWIIFPFKDKITSIMARYFLKYQVYSILKECDLTFKIAKHISPKELIQCRPFRGIINEYIKSDIYTPNVKDIAIAINISIDLYCNYKKEHAANVIDLAYHICVELKKKIALDSSLRNAFKNLGKSVTDIDTEVERKTIEDIFSNKKVLFIEYFTNFSDNRYSYSIKIWHQSNNTVWVDWDEDNSITVKLNPIRIREGFFLTGFDYTENTTGNSLVVASNMRGYELFNSSSGDVIWAR